MQISKWEAKVFSVTPSGFEQMALNIFRIQYEHNEIYKTYVDALGINVQEISRIEDIPFLPIQFFKSHAITTTKFTPEAIFESSGTTGGNTSRHYIKHLSVYKRSFTTGFRLFYGAAGGWCILALLPGYAERQNSSLITMVNDLIAGSKNPYSGFYLDNHEKLLEALVHNERLTQRTLLIGVTFALLDFVEKNSMTLRHTTVMETGGMKGKREEITREEVHKILTDKLGVENVHSEYGMTELLSQAYSKEKGVFKCPPWMQVLIREENDPFAVTGKSRVVKPSPGLLNVIDLANLYSCSFIATDDTGRLHSNGDFEVLGRHDISDVRGCSLLITGNY